MLRIWGRISSVNVQRAVWAAGEVGQEFERIDAGGPFGGLDTPDFGGKNPNRLVPVLEDGDLVTWESNSIVRYLTARYAAGRLWEEEPGRRALADRWMDWTVTDFQPAQAPAFVQLLRTPENERRPDVIEASRARCELKLAVLDRHLAEHAFLGGERFGMADIALGPCIHRWLNMPLPREKRVHVERWFAIVAARPAAAPALPMPVA